MAKMIYYKFMSCLVNRGTEEAPKIEPVLLEKRMAWSEANEETAKAEAINGEYTVEDDGTDSAEKPTEAERIAELEEALDMILSGVTE